MFISNVKKILSKVQNKIYIKIGLFSTNYFTECESEIETKFKPIIVSLNEKELLKEYALNYRSANHYEKNIYPRLEKKERFKGFAVLDTEKNIIVYLSWIDFNYILIKEIDYRKRLTEKKAFFLDDHCVPQYQRKGLHKAVFNKRINYCTNNKISTIMIVIYLNNFRALNNLKKYNFKLEKVFIKIPFYDYISRKF